MGWALALLGLESGGSKRAEPRGVLPAGGATGVAPNRPDPFTLVAIDHSSWLSNELTNRFWAAMPTGTLDFISTTGVGDNAGHLAELDQRIAEGVLAVNVTEPPDDYAERRESHADLPSTCHSCTSAQQRPANSPFVRAPARHRNC